ncbi:hypothetical protein BDP27DRAFT_1335124 [Rhodocollybia butyracea]|uniref:Uncharacterized protein n=1 Tax=Rhodocollybia butyracea TaxID=206335 RepID=A0A9P5U1A8_9AGAR|nr:hypothetical protein BDP27DRAFT_1335124 [Rhodocollybia butyracea]
MAAIEDAIPVVVGEPLYSTVSQLAPVMIVYGIFLLGTCIAVRPMILSLGRQKPKIWLFVGLILVFISFTWNIANTALMGILAGINRTCGFQPSDQADQCPGAELWNGPSMAILEGIPVAITLLVSDMIVVWRAWILLSHNRFWQSVLVLLTVINIIINVVDCIADAFFLIFSEGYNPNSPPAKLDLMQNLIENHSGVLDLISVLTSLLVNAVATSLIGWKAWTHHKSMRKAAIYKRAHSIKILLLLIESGAIFCAIQLAYVVVFPTIQHGLWQGRFRNMDMKFPITSLTTITQPQKNIASDMLIFASAVYPIAVTILVHNTPPPEQLLLYFADRI